MDLLIVESPAKAKTLGKYLGKDFSVLSSYGHVRSLPSESGSVDPDKEFAMHYEVMSRSAKHVEAIVKKVKDVDTIYLATDPDREGEAISWHILEILKKKKALKPTSKVKRVVFHEITKKAVLDAVSNPRDIDMSLVDAQQARLALDYLVGFTLSPVLWRKLPGSRSAGRVQSVALRLIVEREEEVERFKTQEYWSIEAEFGNKKNETFLATLVEYKGEKLEKLTIENKETAYNIIDVLNKKHYSISEIEKKKSTRNPSPPFTTSTLIQEAARKFGFSAKKTSMVAQKLYEGIEIAGEAKGLITYMRTDSVNLSDEAVTDIRGEIEKSFGKNYIPSAARFYKTKSKNAQEAHEAIRPTNITLKPSEIKQYLETDFYKLYELIWKRTIACQMRSAELDVTSVIIKDDDKIGTFRASGSIITFDGFLKIYREDKDDEDEEKTNLLPNLKQGEDLNLENLNGEQHFTQPPPRYTEASLVKKLEELGIGRPSTYPSILSILQERNYVVLEKKRFVPEVRGRIVSAFLVLNFAKYVEYSFTANLENALDDVANGEKLWKAVLKEFWSEFKPKTEEVLKYKNQDVLASLENHLRHFLFPDSPDEVKCPKCSNGTLHLRLGSFGSFIGCSNYPQCDYIQNLGASGNQQEGDEGKDEKIKAEAPQVIGVDEKSGKEIFLKKGPYGHYLQIGEDSLKKRVSLPKMFSPENVDLKIAEFLFSLPKILGKHPETGEEIKLGIGKFGPYVQRGKNFTSVKEKNLMEIDLPQALDIISASANKPKKTFKKK
ncbi:DNA topoisomerase I [endosymbiont of Acanthamoeba sp. UWC8]|uniref:type I DNA topoisomerase n=1 Tax=endosymbiont of Acanthamoeba sp. UWC8 TaxID=86106 RepID=UPI0004D0FEEE|nr:type I DNA topoisomerase [endosymbiont of Acanthamoeba sp. UWC8]AIF81145.1 DNA topoisomerase I [endosymbiont of Acanthamoeba sp. UWC8]